MGTDNFERLVFYGYISGFWCTEKGAYICIHAELHYDN